MSQTNQPATIPNHLRPWSVVDDEELRLLRALERAVSAEAMRVSDHTFKILTQLDRLPGRK